MEPNCLKRISSLGDSEIILAGRKGDVDLLRKYYCDLIEQGFSKDDIRRIFEHHSNRFGKTVLHEAAQNSQEQCIRFLVCKENEDDDNVAMDPDCLKQGDWTPLMLACTKSNLPIIRMLVESGACLTLKNKDGWTPFHIASRAGHKDIVCYFLRLEASNLWRTRSKNGRTPLHTAALYGHESVVDLLLREGACQSPDEVDSCGSTPLIDALRNGHLQIAKRLINAGADPYKQDAVGRQPIHLVAQAGRQDSLKLLLALYVEQHGTEELQAVTADFVNITTNDDFHSTPAHFAAKEGHTAVLNQLVSLGARLDANDEKGRTPLHMAAIAQRAECVQFLLDQGMQNVPDETGQRPSQLAFKPNVIECFQDVVCTSVNVQHQT